MKHDITNKREYEDGLKVDGVSHTEMDLPKKDGQLFSKGI
jgi:hypothetical protein